MKRGFKIVIQSDLTKEEFEIAKDHADWFITVTTNSPDMYYYGANGGRGGRASYLKRNTFGQTIFKDKEPSGLVFRRLYNKSRTFCIMRESELIDVQGYLADHCRCSTCNSQTHNDSERFNKIKLKNPINFTEYAIIGEYKG